MALTDDDWVSLTIDDVRTFGESDEFDERIGDFYRNGRPLHLGHVYLRLRQRIQPEDVSLASLKTILRELSLAEGKFVSSRPEWLGGTTEAFCFLAIGEYIALPICEYRDRSLGIHLMAKTLLVRDDVAWLEAFERGWISVPPRPGLRPNTTPAMSKEQAMAIAQAEFDDDHPLPPRVGWSRLLHPSPASRQAFKEARAARKRYITEVLPHRRVYLNERSEELQVDSEAAAAQAEHDRRVHEYYAALNYARETGLASLHPPQ